MRDVIVLATVVAFFALCLAYVRWCDQIIGADPTDPVDADEPSIVEKVSGPR